MTTVTVRLVLVDRVLEIVRDLGERGCDRDAVVRHYRKHAAADDQALSRHVQGLNQALTAAWPVIRERLPASGDPDEAALRQTVEPVVTRSMDAAGQARRAALGEVDSAAEVVALASACTTRS